MPPAHATEGAVGRPITGPKVASYSGLIPPTPGWTMQIGYVHYSGDIGGDREIPINDLLTLGLDATFDMLTLTGLYVWDTGEGRWNFASMADVPFIDVERGRRCPPRAAHRPGRRQRRRGLFDPFFAPVIAGYHFDQTHHLSLSLYIYTDRRSYEPDRLANLSLNNWTFSPTVGYTQLLQKGTLELSLLGAVDIYTENDATDYQNGAVFRLDAHWSSASATAGASAASAAGSSSSKATTPRSPASSRRSRASRGTPGTGPDRRPTRRNGTAAKSSSRRDGCWSSTWRTVSRAIP